MNDQDRRRPYDGFDDEAIFADIVAHMNDDVAQGPGAAGIAARNPAADAGSADGVTEETAKRTAEETVVESSDSPPADTLPADALPAHPWPADRPPDLPAPGDPPAVPEPLVWRKHQVDDEYEEHFEPPPTTPLPAGDLQFWAILAGMAGGPLLLLYLVFFNRDAGSYWILTAIALSVGGFALLVSRMPGHHDEGDDGSRL